MSSPTQSSASTASVRAPTFAERFVVGAFLLIYFLSGFSALLYQVVWQRMLAIFSGSDLYATTTIVASFMAGLGAGSLIGGSVADRLSPRWQIGMFALTEFFIGVFALASKWWYYDMLYVRYAELASSPALLAIVLFGSLLIPTFLMGMSFPLLSKALTPAIELAGRRIGSLYALNTLGAAIGSFATAWFLLGNRDFPQILRMGARINLFAALVAVVLGALSWRRLGALKFAEEGGIRDSGIEEHRTFPFSTWALIYALSGFLALSLEIVWFRLLGVILKSNSFTFPHLLFVYLACLAVGIMAGTRGVRFGKRPAQIFLGLQTGVMVYAGLSLIVFLWALDHAHTLEWLRVYLGQYEGFDVSPFLRAINNVHSSPRELLQVLTESKLPGFLSLYVAVPLFLIGPPVFLMGASFPFLQRAVQSDRAQIGRRVGWLQGANILGATCGAILVAAVLLHFLGIAWTLRMLIAAGAILGVCWTTLFQPRFRRIGYGAAPGIAILMMWAIPSGPVLWAKLHGSSLEVTISAEDGSGVSVLKNSKADFSETTLVYLNGLGQSWIPYSRVSGIHSQLGIFPVMVHPSPRDVAVIGLGSGDTPFSLGGRAETASITCIEIVKPQVETLRLLQTRQPYGALESLLSDKRFQFVFADGRSYIGSRSEKYDIIEADALRPNSAFAGNLYSYEYFLLLKSRLKPGGFAVTWAPTLRVVETFTRVFPHAYVFGGALIGSLEPIPYDPEVVRRRLEDPFTREYYARAGIDIQALVLPFLDRKLEDVKINPLNFRGYNSNTDLHPKDEYSR